MKRRKVPKDYHELAQKRDLEWLGPIVFNTRTKTQWRCPEGHEWEAIYNSLRDGTGCPFCAGNIPKQSADYHILAEDTGFKWAGITRPKNVSIKTKWECAEGHRWEASYSTIQQRHGCPHCCGQTPKNPTDYLSLAREYNYEWLGPLPINVRTKTRWRCEKGHIWMSSYNNFQQGKKCWHCAGKMPRKVPDDYHRLAKEHNIKWLGPRVANTRIKTKWECAEGHKWKARHDSIQQGHSCPYCSNQVPKTLVDYHNLAEKRGFKWLGSMTPNTTQIKTLWECKKGHRRNATYNSIQQGHGCPHCIDVVNGARVSQIQRDLCKMVGGELNYPCLSFNIDVALLDDRIAIEYDSWYWHGGKLESDRRRDIELIGAGWRILHIRSNNKLPTKNQLNAAIAQLQSGKNRTEIILDDWGHGPTFAENGTQ